MRAWHGTLSPNGKFKRFKQQPGFSSFATEPDGGRIYALPWSNEWLPSSRLFEVELDVRNPLDHLRPDHLELVFRYLEEIGFEFIQRRDWSHAIGIRGAFQALERQDLLLRYGFDAVYTNEWGWRNIHVMDASKVTVTKIYDSDPGQFGQLGESRSKLGWSPAPWPLP